MSSELKPCPFCGGEAELNTIDESDSTVINAVWCIDCESEGGYYSTEAKAIKTWNTRTSEPETYDEIQAEINQLTEKLMVIKRKVLAKEEHRGGK